MDRPCITYFHLGTPNTIKYFDPLTSSINNSIKNFDVFKDFTILQRIFFSSPRHGIIIFSIFRQNLTRIPFWKKKTFIYMISHYTLKKTFSKVFIFPCFKKKTSFYTSEMILTFLRMLSFILLWYHFFPLRNLEYSFFRILVKI